MKIVTATTITHISEEGEVKGKVIKKAGKRVGYNYIIVKSYKESQKNDVVKCLYIKSLTDFGFCVIKEGSYGDTKDKYGRDIIDRLKWQKELHKLLQDKVRMPRLLGSFTERGNYYLVIEHIKGKALQTIAAESKKELRQSLIQGGKLGQRFLDYLIQICGILEKLHEQQIVHRDATPNNYMITPGGKVALIDLELSYSLSSQFPSPAFALGTYGYMSKQQEAIGTPTSAEDIFALGAIILQLWNGVSPGKITNEPYETLITKIPFFIPDQKVSEIVLQCLHPEPDKRPDAGTIKQVLIQYKTDIRKRLQRSQNTPRLFSREEIAATVQQAIETLATPLFADPEKGWFADDMKEKAEADKHKLIKTYYASFNRGDSGIIYMLSQAKKLGMDVSSVIPFVQKGLDRIRERYIEQLENKSAGLHFGCDGIAATLATAIKQNLIEPTQTHLDWIDWLLEKENQDLSIINGVAGQGLANITARDFISSHKIYDRLKRCAQLLMEKQEKEGNWVHGHYKQKFTSRKIPRTNKGFAEGMAGYIYFLLEHAHTFQNKESLLAAERGLQWMMKMAFVKKGIIQWKNSKDKDYKYWWADGTAGIALSFIKAFQITDNPMYKEYASGTLKGIPDNIVDSNIGQYYGVSGLGEVYIEAWRTFREEQWLQRAGWFAQTIMHLKKQHSKYGPYWLVENERQPVGNFMIGNSGVMHFLLRYCNPEQLGFPMTP